MGIFGKKPADPESEFVTGLNDLVRAARKGGVGRLTIRGNLQAHADSLDRELVAEADRRKFGTPISSYDPNLPQ